MAVSKAINRAARSKRLFVRAMLLAVLLCGGCDFKRDLALEGQTMGTRYHIKAVVPIWYSASGLEQRVHARLEAVNDSMSTYRQESEISRFNRFDRQGETFAVSKDFARVMQVGARLYDVTTGAWDATLLPLVNLWGFGPKAPPKPLPDPGEIQRLLADVGFNHIRIVAGPGLQKKHAGITLDLASIAKGYGVDVLAQVMRAAGLNDFLVEIGGEVYASGRRRDGRQWQVGINYPDSAAAADQVYRAVALEGKALATSGDYRNFVEIDGRRYSHVIDPRNGFPVSNGVVSASVIADTCTLADGLATAAMVMGPRAALDAVEGLAGVECLIVVRQSDGSLTDFASSGLRPPP